MVVVAALVALVGMVVVAALVALVGVVVVGALVALVGMAILATLADVKATSMSCWKLSTSSARMHAGSSKSQYTPNRVMCAFLCITPGMSGVSPSDGE